MYDMLLYAVEIAEAKSRVHSQLSLEKKDYYLLTIHRAENTDNSQKLKEIVHFVNNVIADKTVIFPMHPRMVKIYEQAEIKFPESVKIIEPLGYFDLVLLLKYADVLFTDSGGMQKEAFWLKTPCVTLRDETEWVETVESGWNVLYKNYKGFHLISDEPPAIYGRGTTGTSIVKTILDVVNQTR
jgi:UDP-N-acetylglucosamine 2-epimerase